MTTDERGGTPASNRDDTETVVRTILLGSNRGRARQAQLTGLAFGLFVLTFAGYELGIFYHSGGVVFVPFHAALVGVAAALWTGYSQTGVLAGWGLSCLSLLGWRTWAATNVSPRPLTERIAHVLEPDALAATALVGLGVAVIGYTAGALVKKGTTAVRSANQATTDN